ncbi:NAD(P)-binding protein [Lophiostoma macrostomum CBS 122681]|uniref:NAD(P)-binding protein n=1 Tax=Lophiostoma macrostomum CBS 122681 TaxID=1314788 RepID=A0A6A6TAT3_9PLEO|nr:NAD(P)-binding protein [Lophiostoma macrostomum CBS 122681]
MASKGTVLITGCSDGGLGSVLALRFHELGYHVFATARDVSKMSKLAELANTTLLQLDVLVPEHTKSAVEAVTKETGGKLDYLVNMAGIGQFSPLLDENLDDVKRLFDIHVFAPLANTQAFSPLLIEAKGVAVFISSLAGHLHIPFLGSYAGAKIAIETMAETLRLEIAPFGVDVITIVTGAVKSMGHSHFEDHKLPEGSLYAAIASTVKDRAQGKDGIPRMEAEEYAQEVVQAIIEQRAGKFWYGQNADLVKDGTTNTAVSQVIGDAGMTMGTGLDRLGGVE